MKPRLWPLLLCVCAGLLLGHGPVPAVVRAEAAAVAAQPGPGDENGDRVDDILALLLDLDLRRQAIAAQMAAGEQALHDLAIEMAELRRKVRAGRAELERQRAEAGKRVAVLARMEPVDWLSILLGSESFADFVGRWDTAQQLHMRDIAMLQDLQAARRRQQAYLATLAARYERTEIEQRQLARLAAEAEATAAALEAELAALAERRQSYEQQLATLEAEWQERLPSLQRALARLLDLEHNFPDVDHELALSLVPFGARVTVEASAVDAYLAAGGADGWRTGFAAGQLTLTSHDRRVTVAGPLTGDGDALVWTIAELTFAGVAIPPERQSAWIARTELRLRPATLPVPYEVEQVTADGGKLVLLLR